MQQRRHEFACNPDELSGRLDTLICYTSDLLTVIIVKNLTSFDHFVKTYNERKDSKKEMKIISQVREACEILLKTDYQCN